MNSRSRILALALGVLAVSAGTLLMLLTGAGGIGLFLVGAAVIISVGVERRYGRAGAPTDVPLHHFEPTRERFVDDETGQVLEVWIDPLTGERRYEPVAGKARLASD